MKLQKTQIEKLLVYDSKRFEIFIYFSNTISLVQNYADKTVIVNTQSVLKFTI